MCRELSKKYDDKINLTANITHSATCYQKINQNWKRLSYDAITGMYGMNCRAIRYCGKPPHRLCVGLSFTTSCAVDFFTETVPAHVSAVWVINNNCRMHLCSPYTSMSWKYLDEFSDSFHSQIQELTAVIFLNFKNLNVSWCLYIICRASLLEIVEGIFILLGSRQTLTKYTKNGFSFKWSESFYCHGFKHVLTKIFLRCLSCIFF